VAAHIGVCHDLHDAFDSATELIYTDCWPNGDAEEAIRKAFLPHQIGVETLDRMHPGGAFLPCPPVARGNEVTAEAMRSPRCLSYEAKNYLLHAQNAILEFATRA
jgi:ornithine carbamoyltransferase